MLREDVELYSKLTGEDGWNVPIMKVGAYLDGYNKGLEVLDKIRDEIEQLRLHKAQFLTSDNKVCIDSQAVLNVIDKYKAEKQIKESE